MTGNLRIFFSDSDIRQLPRLPQRVRGSEGAHFVFGGTSIDGFVSASLEATGNNTDGGMSTTYLTEVTFEGELSNVISLVPRVAVFRRHKQWKFLRLTQASTRSGSEFFTANEQQQSRQQMPGFPFHFDIPNTTYNMDDEGHLVYEEPLPPSLHIASEKVHHSADLFIRGDCRVSYCVRARIAMPDGRCIAESVRPVTFILTRDCPPPLCVGDFPHEYILDSTQRICRFLPFHTHQLSISTEEPPPLRLSGAKTAFTAITLRLLYHQPPIQAGADPSLPLPSDVFFVTQSTLQATTFFSVGAQGSLPRQAEKQPSEIVVEKTTVCPPQIRKLRFSSWRPIVGHPDNHGGRSPGAAARGWQSTASLVFTSETGERLIPTFACPYASRRYNLCMLLRVDGHRDANFELRVPLQIYCKGNSGRKITAPQSEGFCPSSTSCPCSHGTSDYEIRSTPPVYTV